MGAIAELARSLGKSEAEMLQEFEAFSKRFKPGEWVYLPGEITKEARHPGLEFVGLANYEYAMMSRAGPAVRRLAVLSQTPVAELMFMFEEFVEESRREGQDPKRGTVILPATVPRPYSKELLRAAQAAAAEYLEGVD